MIYQRVVSLSTQCVSSRNKSFSFAAAKRSARLYSTPFMSVKVILVFLTTFRRGAGKFCFSVLHLGVIWRFYSTCVYMILRIVSLASRRLVTSKSRSTSYFLWRNSTRSVLKAFLQIVFNALIVKSRGVFPLICCTRNSFICSDPVNKKVTTIFLSFFIKKIYKHCVELTFSNYQLNAQFFYFSTYICCTTLLNMFRAARCSSSGGPVVSVEPLESSPSVSSRTVHSTVCRWRGTTVVRSPLAYCTAAYRGWRYQRLWGYNWSSWGWAACCSKHVEERSVTYILLKNKRIVH